MMNLVNVTVSLEVICKMTIISSNFQKHIDKIKLAKTFANKICGGIPKQTSLAWASLMQTWEALFDILCENNELSLEDIHVISSIIKKLSASHKEIKTIDQAHRQTKLEKELQRLHAEMDARENGPLPLSDEVIKNVEEQLSLL